MTVEEASLFIGREIDILTRPCIDKDCGGRLIAILQPNGNHINPDNVSLEGTRMPTVEEGPVLLLDWGWGITLSSVECIQ